MKRLDNKVNIIPVIAKADTITKAELHKFKAKVCWQKTKQNKKNYQVTEVTFLDKGLYKKYFIVPR